MFRIPFALATLTLVLGGSLPAQAHVVLAETQASANSYYRATFRVGHGCDGAATTALTVRLPEGFVSARPMPKSGWSVETRIGAYAQPQQFHGREMKEGVREITWTGGTLPDAHYDEFVVFAHLPATLKDGEVLYFPVEQRCGDKANLWTEIPSPANPGARLKSPAAKLAIGTQVAQAGSHAMGHGSATVQTAGTLRIEQPWSRATPGGAKVAGGFVSITNTGSEPDRLIRFETTAAARGELHEMAVVDGIMRMRELANGLVIQPGQTVELKPGGLHVMFMDIRQPFKEGETVSGKFVFEKAGTVDVTFAVRSIAARAQEGGGGHSMHKH